MKSAAAGFTLMAALLALHIAPPPDRLAGTSAADRAFEQRHATENEARVMAELGLEPR